MKNPKSKTNNIQSEEYEVTEDGEIIEKYNIVIDTKKQNQLVDDWYITHTSTGSASWEIKHYNIT
jgi:hypothetical protein